MEKKYIIANWKMNGSASLVRELSAAVDRTAKTLLAEVQLVLCPPAVYLREMAEALKESRVAIGGQNCHVEAKGSFTGEISAAMLSDAGAKYVIVGHSERREHCRETSEQVQNKAKIAISHGLTPIICVGESLAERQAGKAVEMVVTQVRNSIPDFELPTSNHFILAYEPIWAIGSGQIPTVADIETMHKAIVESLAHRTGQQIPVIYGGSVNAENAKPILHASHVSGVLVGGASLKAESFSAIASAAV